MGRVHPASGLDPRRAPAGVAPRAALAVALATAPLVLLAGCSHAPRTAVVPDDAVAPDLGVARPGAPSPPDTSGAPEEPGPDAERGRASYYGEEFEGRRTASGERYRGNRLTAAHRTLPFGTRVKVTNLENGRSVIVVINDRGPHRKGRIIDLSRRAAETLDLMRVGTAPVAVEVIDLAAAELR